MKTIHPRVGCAMKHRSTLRPLIGFVGATWLLATACSSSHKDAAQPKTAIEAVAESPPPPKPVEATPEPAVKPEMTPAASLDALPPPDTDTSATARRSLTMSNSRDKIDPALKIPSPAAKIDAPSQAGVDAAIKAVPASIPVGTLSQ